MGMERDDTNNDRCSTPTDDHRNNNNNNGPKSRQQLQKQQQQQQATTCQPPGLVINDDLDDPNNNNNKNSKSDNRNNNNSSEGNDLDSCFETIVITDSAIERLNIGSIPARGQGPNDQPNQRHDPSKAKAKHLKLNTAKALQQQQQQQQQQQHMQMRREQNDITNPLPNSKKGHHNNNNRHLTSPPNHHQHDQHHHQHLHHHNRQGHQLTSHEYLAQLLKDKKQLFSFPSSFLHIHRILDDEINKVRVALLHDSSEDDDFELPDPVGDLVLLTKKLFVPQKDYPDFNFVGRILGPRGMTAKQLEQDTGCKIMIRGKGSMRDRVKEESFRGKPNWEHLEEELHVLVSAEDTENRAQVKLSRAVRDVEKLLVPSAEGEDSLKKLQLMELAIINGTYRDLDRQHFHGQMAQIHPMSTTVSALGSPRVCMAGPTLIGPPSGQPPPTPTLVTTPVLLTPRIAPYFPPPGTLTRSSMLNPGQQSHAYSLDMGAYDGQPAQRQVNQGLVFQIDPNYVAFHHSPFLEFALFGAGGPGSQPAQSQTSGLSEEDEDGVTSATD